METFRIRAVPGDSTCTLYLTGEADLAYVEDIIDLGTVSLDQSDVRTLIIDFDAVTFIDSTAIGALVHLRNRAIALDKVVTLARVPHRVRRILEITGLDVVFDLSVRDLDDPTPCAAI